MQQTETGLTLLQKEQSTIEQLILLNAPDGMSIEKIKAIAAEEISHVQMIAMQKPEIMQCEPISVILAVKQAIRKNLTLDPSAGLTYVKVRSINVGSQANPAWKKILEIQDTANGKLSIARQCGRVLDHKRPSIYYSANGQVEKVIVEFLVPSVPSPRWEAIEFNTNHFQKWRIASHKENARNKQDADINKLNYANPNYTSWNGSIDPEFASTKAIRHGLGKLGTNINERNAVKIYVDPKEVQIVSAEAAIVEAQDVTNNSTEFNPNNL